MSSMEAALDEERRMVVDLLEKAAENKRQQSSSHASHPGHHPRPSSPSSTRSPARSTRSAASSSPVAPRAPPRSMLDLDGPRPPPRSLLDLDSGASSSSRTDSTPQYATYTTTSSAGLSRGHGPRSSSDSTTRPSMDGVMSARPAAPVDHTSEYQFSSIQTSNIGAALPKRNTQAGKRTTSLLSEGLRGAERPPPAHEPALRYAPPAPMPTPQRKSKSPHNRKGNRSMSPGTGILSSSAGPAFSSPNPDMLTLDSGNQVSTRNAHTILSDANLIKRGIPMGSKKQADEGEGRLQKTYVSPDGDVLTDSSDTDDEDSSDEEHSRGRKQTPRSLSLDAGILVHGTIAGGPSSEDHRQPQSMLAAAEEERVQISALQKQRSLLEPTIMVTAPYGDKHKGGKGGKSAVHPITSFDEGGPGFHTPVDSDTEDIKRAQNLTFSQTGIISQPESHRTLRIVYRGEYGRIQQEANDEGRRLRKYLVASDLSEESTHALEWAVGTVLRDGDTLIAICCIDEESGIVSGDTALVPDEPKAMKEQAVAIREVTASGKIPTGGHSPSPSVSYRPPPSPQAPSFDGNVTSSPAPSNRGIGSAAEMERNKAVELITEKITKLLRRTQLQVRVIVEVLHCKNPKHLITEVIDLINPTLVILGSRGRSALKGVILGSFSNYLVTKSSVPVMVARKRLRKTSKYKRGMVKQVNNLENPTTSRLLSTARID